MISLPEAVELLGVRIHPLTEAQLVDTLTEWSGSPGKRTAFHVNAHALNLACELPSFRADLNRADLVFCDGFGVKWAARLEGHSLPDRMTPPDWIDRFFDRLDPGTSLFLLGDEPEVLASCEAALMTRHPSLRVSGHHHGFFDFEGEESRAVCDLISQSETDVLLVGMGMPRQERWINSNLSSVDVSLAMPVGALFRYYSGHKRRAPRWMTDRGLEWLGRLVLDPRRTYRRYLAGNVRFVARVVRARVTR